MSVIIRLQNLPWSAQAFDIRQYFHGLSIPEGGVHIVGGELGDAFIAFSTDEDARQAMLTDGGKIKEVKIKLYLSSRSEMQKVIEAARTQSLQPYLQQMQATTVQPQAALVQPQPPTITPQAASIQPQVAAIHPQVATVQPQPATITTQVPVSVTQIQTAVTQIQPAINQIPPTLTQTAPAMPSLTQIPIPAAEQLRDAQELPLPPLPPAAAPASTADTAPESASSTVESGKRDQDTESTTSKDNKRSRKGRSRSRSKSRSKNRSNSRSKSRSKSRDRSRSRDRSYRSRYKDKRRRDRSRSRDRRSKRKRDRSRSRDRSRRYSRERKRDYDKNDRNSVESGSNAKDFGKMTPVAENKPEIPPSAVPTPAKPGFSSGGWVPVGSADKSGPMLQKPIGFSISKQPIVPGPPHLNQMPQNNMQPQISQASVIPPAPQTNVNAQVLRPNMHPQMPPLPPQTQLPPPQIPTSTSTQQMMLPHPPPFPGMPMDPSAFPKPNEQNNMPFMPMGYPQAPPSNMATPQQNIFSAQNQPQLPRPMNPNQFQGWAPIRPPMDPSMFNPPGMFNAMPQAPGNMNMGMFNRPPFVPPVNPYAHPDPRLQNAANSQPRPDQNINNSSALQNQSKPPGEYDSSIDKMFNLCVEIRNMSISTTSADIRRFFHGLHIPADGIKIIADKKGNKIGIAYVRFEESYFKDMALKRNGQMLANSNAEILHIDDAIFDKATDFSDQSSRPDSNFYQKPHFQKDYQQESYENFNEEDDNGEIFTDLVIHEAPLNSRDKDIYILFKGFKISDAFVLSGPKKCTGFIRFRVAEEAKRALAVSSRLSIGYTPVKVAICYENEFDEARDRKNMEENDEMMDHKDSIYDHDTRESKKYSHNYAKERSDPRFNAAGRRGPSKALLPTPPSRSFDPRTPHGNKSNPNFPSRFDKREPVKYSRDSRENMSDNQYSYEDSRSRFSSDKSRFQQTPAHSRESYPQKASSQGELRKRPHGETLESAGVDLPPSKVTSSSDQQVKLPLVPYKMPQPDAEKRMEATGKATVDDSQIIVKENPSIDVTSSTSLNRNIEKEENGSSLHQNTPALNASNVVEHPPRVEANTDCLILQGLPYTATDRDILDFFSDVGLAPTKIHIMLDKAGQPAGDAFCEFNTTEEVARALAKNKHIVGRSSVSVRPIPRHELMAALGAVDTLGPEIPYSEEGEHYLPLPMEGHRPSPRFPRMPSHPYPPQFPPRGRGRGAFRGGIGRHQPPPQEAELTTKNVKAFGKPGCVVALENVPFRAEVDDIINFFKDFFVPRDSVIRRFDENGRATGDARVCLSSPVEAQRALRLLNERRIFNRDIYLSLVP